MNREYLHISGNNKFGNKLKNCGMGQFNIENIKGKLFINIFYKEEKVLTLRCYKNPYFIAKFILDSAVETNIKKIKELQERGLEAGLDFMITVKGINLRKRKSKT